MFLEVLVEVPRERWEEGGHLCFLMCVLGECLLFGGSSSVIGVTYGCEAYVRGELFDLKNSRRGFLRVTLQESPGVHSLA
jgi:hypothetical protein